MIFGVRVGTSSNLFSDNFLENLIVEEVLDSISISAQSSNTEATAFFLTFSRTQICNVVTSQLNLAPAESKQVDHKSSGHLLF